MSPPRSRHLLSRVADRQRVAVLGRWFYWALLGAAATYALLVLFSRLTHLLPNYFHWWTLALVPGVALVAGVVGATFHRTRPEDAARLVDKSQQTRDLFLTVTLLDGATGEYQPLVIDQAEAKAPTIRPETVVPFAPGPRLGHGAAALIAVALLLLVPQFDPFHKAAAEDRTAQRERRLAQIQQAVQQKAEVVKKKDVTAKQSPEVEKALAELVKTFEQLKPNEPRKNAELLNEKQKEVNDLWRKTNEELNKNGDRSSLAQQFGNLPSQQSQEMKKQLEKGDTSKLEKAVDQMLSKAEELEKTTDPAKKEALREELKKDMKTVADALTGSTSTPALDQALKQALEQLEMAGMPELSDKAMQGLKDSLKLTKGEAESLSQQLRDAKSLEKALKAIADAKQANKDGMKGDGTSGCKTLEDYAKAYDKMCKGGSGRDGEGDEPGEGGNGMGMGNKGIGEGGKAPENPNADVDFKTEQAQSALNAGKWLLEWKTKGVADSGQAKAAYQKAVQQVKQGVSEAVLQEKVPAGVQDTVQKYFNQLETTEAPPPAKKPE